MKPQNVNSAQKDTAHRIVLVLLEHVWHPYSLGIARYARQSGWEAIGLGVGPQSGIMTTVHDYYQDKLDGILTALVSDGELAAFCRAFKGPVVDLLAAIPQAPATRVLQDNAACGRQGAEHFIQRGFEHLAFFVAQWHWASHLRCQGFCQAASKAGLTAAVLSMQDMIRPQFSDRTWLIESLRRLGKPLGLMAFNDEEAAMILTDCRAGGLHVPQEVAIVGCDNSDVACEMAAVPLSSVDCDMEGQAYHAAKVLDDLMSGKTPPAKPILHRPKGVVVRQSSDVFAVAHPAVAKAMGYIWQRCHEPTLTRLEVAKAVGLTTRGLDKAFGTYVSSSISGEILAHRLRRAQTLLEETNRSVQEIARTCGFEESRGLIRNFRRLRGCTPGAWRRQERARSGASGAER